MRQEADPLRDGATLRAFLGVPKLRGRPSVIRKQSYKHNGRGAVKRRRILARLLSLPRAEVTIVENTKTFAALEGEWDDLYRNSPRATPFQSWAWLYSWWEFYGEGWEKRVAEAATRALGGWVLGM
jgi:CelD/BcsL family acetyltransferase involved in cellulose biosynthesis